jgi:hypothetical protein
MTGTLGKDEQDLLTELGSPDVTSRETAALRLNQWAHPVVLKALRSALDDAAPEVREAAAQSLALLDDRDALELVIGAAERSSSGWPRASYWAAATLAITSDEGEAMARVRRLIELAERSGPDGLLQAKKIRALIASRRPE